MLRLTRRYRFAASHRLHAPALEAEKNRAIYGKCNNPWGHGHDYIVEISVAGPPDPITGRVVNVSSLDGLVRESIIEPLDHHNLNEDIPEFAAAVPTSENLAREIESRLVAAWPSMFPDGRPVLAGIRLRETRRNSFEIRR